MISADIHGCMLRKSPKVGRLFEDYEAAERDYYRRTGIFPIMHTVVVRRRLAEEHPEVVKSIYRGFCSAKDATMEQFVKGMTFNNMAVMVLWLTQRIDEDRNILGEDWWPYGIKANRSALDAILRYHHEQGLTLLRFTVEDVFVPYLLGTKFLASSWSRLDIPPPERRLQKPAFRPRSPIAGSFERALQGGRQNYSTISSSRS